MTSLQLLREATAVIKRTLLGDGVVIIITIMPPEEEGGEMTFNVKSNVDDDDTDKILRSLTEGGLLESVSTTKGKPN
jgi:hypothetical protein